MCRLGGSAASCAEWSSLIAAFGSAALEAISSQFFGGPLLCAWIGPVRQGPIPILRLLLGLGLHRGPRLMIVVGEVLGSLHMGTRARPTWPSGSICHEIARGLAPYRVLLLFGLHLIVAFGLQHTSRALPHGSVGLESLIGSALFNVRRPRLPHASAAFSPLLSLLSAYCAAGRALSSIPVLS